MRANLSPLYLIFTFIYLSFNLASLRFPQSSLTISVLSGFKELETDCISLIKLLYLILIGIQPFQASSFFCKKLRGLI
jgi:hypothetical protein